MQVSEFMFPYSLPLFANNQFIFTNRATKIILTKNAKKNRVEYRLKTEEEGLKTFYFGQCYNNHPFKAYKAYKEKIIKFPYGISGFYIKII